MGPTKGSWLSGRPEAPRARRDADEVFLLQLLELLHSQALILMGDFNHSDVCWKNIMASYKQSRRLLERIKNNFLVQVLNRTNQRDLVLTNTEEVINDIKIGGSLDCSDHALEEHESGKEWSKDPKIQESELQVV